MKNHPKQATLKIASIKTQAIFRAFFDSAKANLAGAAGDDASEESRGAAAFLHSQAISTRRTEELEIGFCRTPERMTQTLADEGFSIEEIAASGLLDDGRIAGRLIGPLFDDDCRIVNFWAIRPIPHDASVLFYRDPRGDVACDLEVDHPGEVLKTEGLAAFLTLIHGEPEPREEPVEESDPVVEEDPLSDEEQVPEEEPAVEDPPVENPPSRPRRRVGYCRLHDCDETDCFCFD